MWFKECLTKGDNCLSWCSGYPPVSTAQNVTGLPCCQGMRWVVLGLLSTSASQTFSTELLPRWSAPSLCCCNQLVHPGCRTSRSPLLNFVRFLLGQEPFPHLLLLTCSPALGPLHKGLMVWCYLRSWQRSTLSPPQGHLQILNRTRSQGRPQQTTLLDSFLVEYKTLTATLWPQFQPFFHPSNFPPIHPDGVQKLHMRPRQKPYQSQNNTITSFSCKESFWYKIEHLGSSYLTVLKESCIKLKRKDSDLQGEDMTRPLLTI